MSVIIEIPTNDKTEWGVSFTSHNPEPHDYVECASYKDAERLHVYLLGINEQTAIRESELSASQAREAKLREKLADREAAFEARTIDFNSAYNANIAYAEQVRELKQRAEAAEASIKELEAQLTK